MRVRWSALELDADLAAGTAPASNEDLKFRARQLAAAPKRAEMADTIRDLVAIEHCAGARIPTTRAPLSRHRIQSNREQLDRIVELLEADDVPPVRGLAMVHLLLEDARSALYAHELSGQSLEPALQAIVHALQGD
jgi:hypothetical protein